MVRKIFISYRRGDEPGFAHALFARLEQSIPADRIFFDVDSISPGLDFVETLEDRVADCDIVLVLIGRGWLSAEDSEGRRRPDDPKDFVRIEIESALKFSKRVVPVLLNNAKMPQSSQLPKRMRRLATRQAVQLTHERFRAEVSSLTNALSRMMAEADQNELEVAALAPAEEPPVRHAGNEDSKLKMLLDGARRLVGIAGIVSVLLLVAGSLYFLSSPEPTDRRPPSEAVVLGMVLVQLDANESKRYGMNNRSVLVMSVTPGSPAAISRVQANTLLVAIGEYPINTPVQAREIVSILLTEGKESIFALFKTELKDSKIHLLKLE